MPDDIVIGDNKFPNPKNVQVKADTDPPDNPAPTSVKMDVSNPVAAQIIPKSHPLQNVAARPKTARHPLGSKVLKVSDN